MDYLKILEQIQAAIVPVRDSGKVADYIPELARVAPDRFGMAIVTLDGQSHSVGDVHERFSIQSISKLFALVLALQTEGDELWRRVGREPSGTAGYNPGGLAP